MTPSSRPLTCGLFAAALLAPFGSAFADTVVAAYPFFASDWTSHTETTAAFGSNISAPLGGNISSGNQSFFKTNVNNAIPESLADALTSNHYLGFTITPNNHRLDYRNFSFDFGLSNATGSVDYTGYWAVYSSVTGFAAGDLIATGSFYLPRGSGQGPTWQVPSTSIDLSAIPALQQIVDPVEFRIVFWDDSPTGSSFLIMRFDTIEVRAATESLEPIIPVAPDVVIAVTGGGLVQLVWDGQPGLTYTVESSLSPDPVTFQTTGQVYSPTSIGPVEATLIAEGDRMFYRITTSVTPN